MNKERMLFEVFLLSAVLILMKIWLPPNDSVSFKVLDSFYWLAVSFVPGYFVYLTVAYFPMKRDRSLLAPFIASQTSLICVSALFLLRDISKTTGAQLNMASSQEEIEQAWSKIDRQSFGPLIKRTNPITSCTWMEVVYDYKFRSIKAIDTLLCYVPYLEAEHLRLLTDIRHCYFFSCVDGAMASDGSPNDFGISGASLHELISLATRLDAYLERSMGRITYVKISDYKSQGLT